MKISIITATFNRESTIIRAISSIQKQSYYNIQNIIVDGASKDNTINLIRPILRNNDILISEPDDGTYDALNKGINLSNGNIIAFLHSDDLYSNKDVVSNVMKLFLNKEIDIVYGDVSFFKKDKPDTEVRIYQSDVLSKKNLAWGKMPAHPAMFIRREIYEKIGLFDTNYIIAGDYEFLCRLVNKYNFNAVYIPNILVKMQVGGLSTQGIKSFYILNKETYRAILSNGIYTNIFMLLSKYFSKIRQLRLNTLNVFNLF